jgi:hypothetical protein
VSRTYLFVPPEEKAKVQALGACWDAESKRWYIASTEVHAPFARWLPEAQAGGDEEFIITSGDAYVAAATTPCGSCQSPIEVICIYCESGTVFGDPLTRFIVSNVWAMDDALARQLKRWPTFHKAEGMDAADSWANYCPHCDALQDDMLLHSEPGDPFFNIPRAEVGAIRVTPLTGTIRLSGDEHFEVD